MDIKDRKKSRFFPNQISKNQAKDTGMAMVLIFLLVAWFGDNIKFVGVAIILLILNMITADIYVPAARIWLGISNIIGTFISKIILTAMFFLIVTPIGVIRRWMGADSMKTGLWKNGKDSVFSVRDHCFQPEDIEKPY